MNVSSEWSVATSKKSSRNSPSSTTSSNTTYVAPRKEDYPHAATTTCYKWAKGECDRPDCWFMHAHQVRAALCWAARRRTAGRRCNRLVAHELVAYKRCCNKLVAYQRVAYKRFAAQEAYASPAHGYLYKTQLCRFFNQVCMAN